MAFRQICDRIAVAEVGRRTQAVLLSVTASCVIGIQASLPLSLGHNVTRAGLNVAPLCIPSFGQVLPVLGKVEREIDDT